MGDRPRRRTSMYSVSPSMVSRPRGGWLILYGFDPYGPDVAGRGRSTLLGSFRREVYLSCTVDATGDYRIAHFPNQVVAFGLDVLTDNQPDAGLVQQHTVVPSAVCAEQVADLGGAPVDAPDPHLLHRVSRIVVELVDEGVHPQRSHVRSRGEEEHELRTRSR